MKRKSPITFKSFRFLFALTIIFLVVACSKSVTWERYDYVEEKGSFSFRGESYSSESRKTADGLEVKLEFIPQKHYGYNDTSYSGPYKLKVYASKNNFYVSNVEIYSNTNHNISTYNKSGNFELTSDSGSRVKYHIFDELISPSEDNENSIIIVVKVIINGTKNEATLVYKFNHLKSEGETDVPYFTT